MCHHGRGLLYDHDYISTRFYLDFLVSCGAQIMRVLFIYSRNLVRNGIDLRSACRSCKLVRALGESEVDTEC